LPAAWTRKDIAARATFSNPNFRLTSKSNDFAWAQRTCFFVTSGTAASKRSTATTGYDDNLHVGKRRWRSPQHVIISVEELEETTVRTRRDPYM
jgi:hypothetical protein